MEAALAARQTPLDRRALLLSTRPLPTSPPPAGSVRFASDAPVAASPLNAEQPVSDVASKDGRISVPSVAGLAPRTAVRRLHAAGFRVEWDGGAQVIATRPAAGTRTLPGDTIRVLTRASRP
jgi:hypothetical protein